MKRFVFLTFLLASLSLSAQGNYGDFFDGDYQNNQYAMQISKFVHHSTSRLTTGSQITYRMTIPDEKSERYVDFVLFYNLSDKVDHIIIETDSPAFYQKRLSDFSSAKELNVKGSAHSYEDARFKYLFKENTADGMYWLEIRKR